MKPRTSIEEASHKFLAARIRDSGSLDAQLLKLCNPPRCTMPASVTAVPPKLRFWRPDRAAKSARPESVTLVRPIQHPQSQEVFHVG